MIVPGVGRYSLFLLASSSSFLMTWWSLIHEYDDDWLGKIIGSIKNNDSNEW